MAEREHPKVLFLVDDGWRYERRELLRAVKGRLSFDVATHDPRTYDALKAEHTVHRLERVPLRGGLAYTLVMFFARELDTQFMRTMGAIYEQTRGGLYRAGARLRRLAARLGCRRYSYEAGLRWLYRRSRRHGALLRQYDALLFSPVAVMDKRIVFEAERRGVRRIVFVYSWDNPIKDNEFPVTADSYLVWNEPCRQLVQDIHGVPASRIRLVGPVQFEYLLHRKPPGDALPEPRPYVLYACAMGEYDFLIEQEIRLIRQVRTWMNEINPAVRLVVRPYPFSGLQDAYAELRGIPGIDVADFGRFRDQRIEIEASDLEEKMQQIEQALGLINAGSTIALEASYTKTPILQIFFNLPGRYKPWQDLARLLQNDHLRFFRDGQSPNILETEEALVRALRDILQGRPEAYIAYSRFLHRFARPFDVPSFHSVFVQELEACLRDG